MGVFEVGWWATMAAAGEEEKEEEVGEGAVGGNSRYKRPGFYIKR